MSATLYGSAFASTETDANVCYGINGGLDLYAAIQAPSLFNYDFNTKYSIFATDVSHNESSPILHHGIHDTDTKTPVDCPGRTEML